MSYAINYYSLKEKPLPIIPSPEKKEEEGLSVIEETSDHPTVSCLSDDTLAIIFRFATNNAKSKEDFSNIRRVCRHWHRLFDTDILGPCWGQLTDQITTPSLQSLSNQFLLSDSANSPYFSRFYHLTQKLRQKGAPIPRHFAVLGFEPHLYAEAQRQIDASLEILWATIQPEIDFKGTPIPNTPKAIRQWFKDPKNTRKLNRITQLHLNQSNLTVLPPEIGKLRKLKYFDLRDNQLITLPSKIGKLKKLEHLDLKGNQLTFLPSKIGKLKKLEHLDLTNNQLTALPPEIGNLNNLKWLFLWENKLKDIPSEIGKLTQLLDLRLFSNQLEDLPPEIGKLTQLTELHLHMNRLTKIPSEIGKLTQLRHLSLNDNELANLPSEIGELRRINYLYLQHNQLTTLPPEIGELHYLQALNLGHNQFADLPSPISSPSSQLSYLYWLNLSNNPLTSFPSSLNLPYLRTIVLKNTPFSSLVIKTSS